MGVIALKVSFFSIAFLAMPEYTTGQEMKPIRIENAEWKNVVHERFDAGKRGRALEIIRGRFMKARIAAGVARPEIMLELATGEYDLMIVWHMMEGVEAMNWELTADNIAWRSALNKQEGRAEKAGALLEKYQGLIAKAKSEIGMVRQ